MDNLAKRKNIRLKDYAYSSNGAYFITVCTENRNVVLSEIRRGDPCGRPSVILTKTGEIAEKTFSVIVELFDISIDKYVIMPNHIHFMFTKNDSIEKRATVRLANKTLGQAPTVGRVVGAYKSIIVGEWLKICKQNNEIMGRLWQRNYYEHIIRDENDYLTKWNYIDTNPERWEEDEYYKK